MMIVTSELSGFGFVYGHTWFVFGIALAVPLLRESDLKDWHCQVGKCGRMKFGLVIGSRPEAGCGVGEYAGLLARGLRRVIFWQYHGSIAYQNLSANGRLLVCESRLMLIKLAAEGPEVETYAYNLVKYLALLEPNGDKYAIYLNQVKVWRA